MIPGLRFLVNHRGRGEPGRDWGEKNADTEEKMKNNNKKDQRKIIKENKSELITLGHKGIVRETISPPFPAPFLLPAAVENPCP